LARGAVATVFDYFFDLLVAVFFALSSALVLVGGGGAGAWALCALVILIAGFLLYGAVARLAVGTARSLGSRGRSRFHGFCTTIALSPLLVPKIGRRLLAISVVRFGINEWAASSVLFALGTPFQVSAQWAVVNRVLVAIAAGLCGIAGLLIAVAARSLRPPRVV